MKSLVALLVSLLALGSARADLLGRNVEIPSSANWTPVTRAEPGQPPFPTLKYVPKSGSRAELLISLLPTALPTVTVADLATLKQFNLMAARPLISNPAAPPPVTEVTVPNGLGVYLTSEDPSLVGKPTPPGEFRFATVVSVLLGAKAVLHCTVFYDTADSAELHQALQFICSAKLCPEAPIVLTRSGFDATLTLPIRELLPSGPNQPDNQGYFAFADHHGLMLSGWIDGAQEFKDMTSFWAKEKANLLKNPSLAISDEQSKEINGWHAVLYTFSLEKVSQKNLRACQVLGNTWIDVHLSLTRPDATWAKLEAMLTELQVATINK